MDSFLKPVILAVLWLVFAARPAFADELTNLLSNREQILKQFAENGQYTQTARTNNDRTSGSADELIGNAMGLLGVPLRRYVGLHRIRLQRLHAAHLQTRDGHQPAAYIGRTGTDGLFRFPKRPAARRYGLLPHARRRPDFTCRTLYRQRPLHPCAAHGKKYRNHQPKPQILEQ